MVAHPALANIINVDREELAWAAGFFDGEGCTFTNWQDGRAYPAISIAQSAFTESCPDVLLRFQRAVGLARGIYGPTPRRTEKHRPQWHFNIRGFEPVQAIVAMLWAWLGDVKRQQAHRALSIYLNQPPPMAKAERMKRLVAGRLARTTCRRGHPWSLENTFRASGGTRVCRTCKRIGRLRREKVQPVIGTS